MSELESADSMEEVEPDEVQEGSDNGVALVTALIDELTSHPELAVGLVHTLSKITKPWEALGGNGNPLNAMPVPPGESSKAFRRKTMGGYISGYRLTTIFGNEVATIAKDTPKWRITIEGNHQVDSPFVEHAQKAEEKAKTFAESKLKELGYIIG
jgi:hypothetical protein